MNKKRYEPISSSRVDSLVNRAKMGDLTAKKELLYHSVRLETDYCKGCTTCMRYCPTQAIRVQNGKAKIIKEFGSISGKLSTGYKQFDSLDDLGDMLKYVSTALKTTPTISDIEGMSKDIANFIGQKKENISAERMEYIFSDEFRNQFDLNDMSSQQLVEFYKFLKSDSFQTYRDLDSAEVLEQAAEAIRKGASAEDFEEAYFDYLSGEEYAVDEIQAFERVKEKFTKVEAPKKSKKKKAVVNKQKRRKSRKRRNKRR